MSTIPTFAVRETDVSRHNGDTSGAPLKPLRVDSALIVYNICPRWQSPVFTLWLNFSSQIIGGHREQVG